MVDAPAISVDVVVVGGGPAGIAAACTAAEAGRDVVVLDDNPNAGGQIWRGGRQKAGVAAARWFDRLAASGARVHPGAAVVDVCVGTTLVTRGPSGIRCWNAGAVILATGARERFVPFPGWTLPGVAGAGGLQALVKQGYDIAGKHVLLAGTGPLLLAVAEVVVRSGGRLAAIAEQAPLRRLAPFAAALVAHPAKLAQAVRIRGTIGNVLRTGTFPEGVRRDGDALLVSLVSGPEGRERRWECRCDVLGCGFGLVPNVELARLLGCRVEQGRIATDPIGRTNIPGVWAAGECTGVGGVDTSLVEGRIAGLAAAGRLVEAERLVPAQLRARRFADRLDHTFALDPRLAQLADDDTIVCRCEDVTAGRLRCHTNWREAKLMTRIGMGPCQGRVCGTAADVMFGWKNEDTRPPLMPISVGDLVSPHPPASQEGT